jgi:periplasmic mercuric ion binding protein
MKKTKTAISMVVLTIFMLAASGTFAQKSTKEIKIATSAQCGMCKDRIEGALAYETGIKSSSLDIPSKVLTVKYNTAKTDETKIRKVVNNLGYDADDTKADPTAYSKLPACCKKKEGDHSNCKH